MFRKKACPAVCIAIVLVMFAGQIVLAANSGEGLTWDGKAATLAEIAKYTGYDLAGSNGNYKPLYTFAAENLWNLGLFSGSNGSFDLDMPLTKEQGVVMILRLLGKESEAKSLNLDCKFSDVSTWAKPYVAYSVQNGIANGISATQFGGGDVMTANLYCTLILRIMGYKDNEDFTWNKAIDKAVGIGLIGEPCHNQYTHSNLFLRDNAVVIAYNAINGKLMKDGSSLSDNISFPGKPSGAMPTAVRVDTSTPPSSAAEASVTIGKPTGLTVVYNYTSGTLVSLTATYTLSVSNDYSGTLDIDVTAGGTTKIIPVNVTGRGQYTLSYLFTVNENKDTVVQQPDQKIISGTDPITKMPRYTTIPGSKTTIPGAMVNNSVTIKAGSTVFNDTISVKGTITGVYPSGN